MRKSLPFVLVVVALLATALFSLIVSQALLKELALNKSLMSDNRSLTAQNKYLKWRESHAKGYDVPAEDYGKVE